MYYFTLKLIELDISQSSADLHNQKSVRALYKLLIEIPYRFTDSTNKSQINRPIWQTLFVYALFRIQYFFNALAFI